MLYKYFVFSALICFLISDVEGLLKRCFTCRSRGDLGTCKDPFTLNSTQADAARGVDAAPCASGWCGKMLEGGSTYKDDDYGIATQRMCLQRGPSDNEERCAYTVWNYKKVYMCFCQGDLCNGANHNFTFNYSIIIITCFSILLNLKSILL